MLEMCQAQDVEVVNSKREKVTDTFIANMAEYKKKSGRPGAGMVWRWQVGTFLLNPGVFLKVQALPCNLDAVKANPVLRQDSTRCISVARFPVSGKLKTKNIHILIPLFNHGCTTHTNDLYST